MAPYAVVETRKTKILCTESVSKYVNFKVHLCACIHVRQVSTGIYLNPSSTKKLLICPIYYRLFHSIVRGSRIHMPPDWNHCRRENVANTLRGAAILKVSESLISSWKSSRRIYGKWESWDGKWSSSAGYTVITVFCIRQSTVSSHFQAGASVRTGHSPRLFVLALWGRANGKHPQVNKIYWERAWKDVLKIKCIWKTQNRQESNNILNQLANPIVGFTPEGCSMKISCFDVWLENISLF